MITPKFAELRGDFALKNLTKGETVFTPVFSATTGALNFSVSTEKVPGTGNKRGTIFTYETDRAATLSITAKSRHRYMLQNYLLGKAVTRAAAAAVAFVYPALKAGEIFELPARNILGITVTGKVAGVDFELLSKSGTVAALTANAAAITTCTFDNGAYDEIGIFSEDAQNFEILFSSEASGQSYKLYNGLLVPDGDFALVQESGVGEGQIKFELSQVTTAVADATLGKYGRGYNVA